MKCKRVEYEMNEERCGHVADLSDTDISDEVSAVTS